MRKTQKGQFDALVAITWDRRIELPYAKDRRDALASALRHGEINDGVQLMIVPRKYVVETTRRPNPSNWMVAQAALRDEKDEEIARLKKELAEANLRNRVAHYPERVPSQ